MILSQLHISFLSRANVPEAIQPCMTTLPLHLTPSCANILGASTAGFAAPYQLFNFPGSTTSSFLEAAACQAAAILWSRVDRAHCGRIKPCTLSEKVLFLVLLFLFFSPTLRNSSYSNWLPLPAWGMENNFFFLSGVGRMARWHWAAASRRMVRGSLPKLLGWGLVCRAVGQQRY